MTAGRTFRVTLLLAALGGLVGALCGLLAIVPIPLQQTVLNPTRVHGASAAVVAPWTAGFGAVFGFVLGPPLALSLLRRAPLWRVLLWPALGALLGSFVGRWLYVSDPFLGEMSVIIAGPIVGMVAGGILLRMRTRVESAVSDAAT